MFFSDYFSSITYRFGYELHRMLFLRPGKRLQKSKLIVVGSFRVGGAGKTPVAMELAKKFALEGKSVAVLVHAVAADEELLLQRKLVSVAGLVKVIRTKNRYKTSLEIDGTVDVIVCDDGFEDSRMQPDETILLDWNEPCELIHDLWPSGNCRSLRRDHPNITKTLQCEKDVLFSVEKIVPLELWKNGERAFIENSSSCLLPFASCFVVCGLGDPERFELDVETCLKQIDKCPGIADLVVRPDHDNVFAEFLEPFSKENAESAIIISEKDACRLLLAEKSFDAMKNVFIAVQKVELGGK